MCNMGLCKSRIMKYCSVSCAFFRESCSSSTCTGGFLVYSRLLISLRGLAHLSPFRAAFRPLLLASSEGGFQVSTILFLDVDTRSVCRTT